MSVSTHYKTPFCLASYKAVRYSPANSMGEANKNITTWNWEQAFYHQILPPTDQTRVLNIITSEPQIVGFN